MRLLRTSLRATALVAAAVIALTPRGPSASAQELLPVGWIDASANGELSMAVPIRIRPPSLEEEIQRIDRLFADELGRRGYAVTEDARANALSFRFVTDRAVDTEQPFPHVRVRPPFERKEEKDLDDIVPTVDDGRDRPTRLQSSPKTLVVEIVGTDRRLIWSGRATAAVKTNDLEEIAALTVPALLDRLGRDATGEDFYAPLE